MRAVLDQVEQDAVVMDAASWLTPTPTPLVLTGAPAVFTSGMTSGQAGAANYLNITNGRGVDDYYVPGMTLEDEINAMAGSDLSDPALIGRIYNSMSYQDQQDPKAIAKATYAAVLQDANRNVDWWNQHPNGNDGFMERAMPILLGGAALLVAGPAAWAALSGGGTAAVAGGVGAAAGEYSAAAAMEAGLADSIGTIAVGDLSSVAFMDSVAVSATAGGAAAAGAGVSILESALPGVSVPLDATPIVAPTTWGTSGLGVTIAESSFPALTMPALDSSAITTALGGEVGGAAAGGIVIAESAFPALTVPALDTSAITTALSTEIGGGAAGVSILESALPGVSVPLDETPILFGPQDVMPYTPAASAGAAAAASTPSLSSIGSAISTAKGAIGAVGSVIGVITGTGAAGGASGAPGSIPAGAPAANNSGVAILLGALFFALNGGF